MENTKRYVSTNIEAKNIIEKYWTEKCDKELKKLCKVWGAFAHHFLDFKEIITEENYKKLLEELKYLRKRVTTFSHSTFYFYFVEYKNYEISTEIPETKQPCIICKKKISLKAFDNYSFRRAKSELKINSPEDFLICRSCIEKYIDKYKTQTKDKKESLKLLKGLYELLGFIPPKDYYSIRLIKELPNDKIKNFFTIIQKMPYPDFFNKECGSWFNALIESGILEDGTRKLSRGTMCKAKDGHICLSISEKVIDDWLTSLGIKHSKEPNYPKDEDLNPQGLLRADWKVGKYYVEFFGLKGQKDYDIKIELKKDLCNKKGITLIEIYQDDLKNLHSKFKDKLEVTE